MVKMSVLLLWWWTDAIVFVVDSVDVERMEEAKMELMRTAKSPDNSQVPILILANKQDLPGARDPKEIEKHLGLHELGPGHLYHIQPACAITGEGLDDGLDVLYEMIGKRKKHTKMNKKKGIPAKFWISCPLDSTRLDFIIAPKKIAATQNLCFFLQ